MMLLRFVANSSSFCLFPTVPRGHFSVLITQITQRMQKLQLLVVLTLVLIICAKRGRHGLQDIPGVSEENMTKLREIFKSGREEFRQKMDDWLNSLPEEEKKVAEAHREEIRKRHEARRAQKAGGDAEAESDD
ncbi:unnamed protein product [Cylicocyclus nassatus]|uniref:Uncharacterized protein n=1 Tax=Cylicocyclus nassatus TaxID=53992 RepID=A0AA36DPG4_CYLNA|nr:unnamed protein product [Cylicocyclus nassatus]